MNTLIEFTDFSPKPIFLPIKHLLFFVQKKFAIVLISGIITTNLGKTATHTKSAGRKKMDTHSKICPSP